MVWCVCSQNNYPIKPLTLIQIVSETRKCNLGSLAGRKKMKVFAEKQPLPLGSGTMWVKRVETQWDI